VRVFLKQKVVDKDTNPRGYTHTQLAGLMGLSQPSVTDFLNEKGGTSFQSVEKLAKAFGLEPMSLLNGAADETPASRPVKVLRDKPGWSVAVEEVRVRYPHIPADVIDLVGSWDIGPEQSVVTVEVLTPLAGAAMQLPKQPEPTSGTHSVRRRPKKTR
jgi:transcriptional regulator with XRE-family HTH domain